MEREFLPIACEKYGRTGETARKFVKNLPDQLTARKSNGRSDLGLQNNLYLSYA